MCSSPIKVMKLVDWYNKLEVTNDSKELLSEYAFLCAKYAYILRNIEMVYKTYGKREIIKRYINEDYNGFTRYINKYDLENDIPITSLDPLNFGSFINLKNVGYIKAILNSHFALINKTITDEFYHTGRIIALSLYSLGGGLREIKDITKALSKAQTALWRLTFKKNGSDTLVNKSKKINRVISKDFFPKHIIQLFYNIIYRYLESSNFENKNSKVKIKTILYNHLSKDKCTLRDIIDYIKPYIDSITPVYINYREFYRNDYSSNLSNGLSISEITKDYNSENIHPIILDVKRDLCFSKDYNYKSIEHDNLFRDTLESDYIYRTRHVLVNNTTNIVEYTIPSYSGNISNDESINNRTSARKKYDDIYLDNGLSPIVEEDTNSSNTNITSDKDLVTYIYDLSNSYLEPHNITFNSKYRIRITSPNISKNIKDGIIGNILVKKNSITNRIEKITTKGIIINQFIIDTLVNHAEKYSKEILDLNSIIMFDDNIHEYSISNN